MDEELVNALWVDYLLLGEKYQEGCTLPEFGYYMVKFAAKMLADCAPLEGEVWRVVTDATKSGIEWSNERDEEVDNG